jgi:hypothetical protein
MYDGKAARMMEKPNIAKFKPDPKLKLMDQVRQVLRYHHYAYRTEQSYCDWILRYVKFHGGNNHPAGMGKKEIDAFLSHLATHLGELRLHIERVRRLHEEDLPKGFGEVFLPSALSRKYPRAGREFRWQYVFTSKSLSVDPRSNSIGRVTFPLPCRGKIARRLKPSRRFRMPERRFLPDSMKGSNGNSSRSRRPFSV